MVKVQTRSQKYKNKKRNVLLLLPSGEHRTN